MQPRWSVVVAFTLTCSRRTPQSAAILVTICAVCGASLGAWAADATPGEPESVSIHGQVTYNWQYHPSFASPYAGVNSLKGNAESMYTFSATAHWGFRPWQNGELYFNPEVVSGVPFSDNLVGLGSFTNGEITRRDEFTEGLNHLTGSIRALVTMRENNARRCHVQRQA